MSDAPAQQYLIAQGVHRCVAAREAGLSGVLAQVELDGKKVGVRVITLDCLVSPKAVISRWDRGWDFRTLVERMKTADGRAAVTPVFVVPMTPETAARHSRLLDVIVLEDLDEGLS